MIQDLNDHYKYSVRKSHFSYINNDISFIYSQIPESGESLIQDVNNNNNNNKYNVKKSHFSHIIVALF